MTETVRVRYVSIWKLVGSSKLVSDKDSILLAQMVNPIIIAHVTADPEPQFQHIDRSAAIITQILKGLFTESNESAIQERVTTELRAVKVARKERIGVGVFLVLEGETEIPTPEFKNRRDTGEFTVCFDAVDKDKIRDDFRPYLDAFLIALSLNLPSNADRNIERAGEVIHLVDPIRGNPIYSFTAKFGSPRLSVAAQLTEGMILDAGQMVPAIAGDKSIARPVSLLIASLNQTMDGLQAFVAAWSALEVFINASFKLTYEAEWFKLIKIGAPASGQPVFERLKEVMSDKYGLSNKFLIIASVLDEFNATTDADNFKKLKKIRDDLLHALETPEHLPTEAVQTILGKYLRLHCLRQNG